MKYLLLFLLTLFALNLFAQFSTVTIKHDNSILEWVGQQCNGVLETTAMGDSGPFSVSVFNSSRVKITSFNLMIGEQRTLENICAGNYHVVYFDTDSQTR